MDTLWPTPVSPWQPAGAVTGDKVVMAPTLDEAMTSLFTKQQPMAVFDKASE